ncbi:CsgG/HfaB family protein [Paraglaciecola sp.]|uniref:CsgG/HfaB family protein n=1 Tax=Paraglaciecola sp. TaxID=1920173 RepID=UPI003EF2A9D9
MYQTSSGAKLGKTNNLRTCFTKLIAATLLTTMISSCMSTAPKMGDTEGNTVTGGAGGANADGSNPSLEKCDETLGTLSIFEDTSLTWWRDYRSRYPKLGSTLPVVRLMIQQSNCFVVVERGAVMAAMNRERQLMQSGQLRAGSNIGGGQMVAADYTLSPSIQFSAEGTKGLQAIGGALLGGLGSLVGGGLKKNEASTTLLLIENRSGVQVSAALGSAGNWDFNIFGGLFAGPVAGGARGFSKTPEGKIITAAFADSFNQMVKALRNYKAQQVKGGLGKGGRLTVGGADDAMPQATNGARVVPAPAPKPTYVAPPVQVNHTVSRKKNLNFEVEEYDEDALKDYYNSLKSAGTWISALATAEASMAEGDKHKGMFRTALNMFSSQLESHKIELEAWPMEAKQEAWRVMGKRIQSHSKSFEKYKKLALENEHLAAGVRSMLQSVTLITKESLLGL